MIEKQVAFTLAAHPMDPTGEDIYIEGTFDQVRVENQRPRVNDLKTGKKTGWEMLHDHAIQIAAYSFGARQIGIVGCQPGPIIRAYGYRQRDAQLPSPTGVFFQPLFDWSMVEAILEPVRLHVALFRMGEINWTPGPYCTFCEFQGLVGCTEHYQRLVQLGRIDSGK